MKKILSILSLVTSALCYGQEKYKICRIYLYQGDDSLNKKLSITERYSTKGMIVSREYHLHYDDDGKISGTQTGLAAIEKYDYNLDTLLVKSETVRIWKQGRSDTELVYYYYGTNNKLTKVESHEYGYIYLTDRDFFDLSTLNRDWRPVQITTYKYDINNKVIETKTKEKESNLLLSIEGYQYDNQDSLEAIFQYAPYEGDTSKLGLVKKKTFTYSSRGYTETDGSSSKTVEYIFDSNKQLIEKIETFDGSTVYKYHYQSPYNGRLLKREWLQSGKHRETAIYIYE